MSTPASLCPSAPGRERLRVQAVARHRPSIATLLFLACAPLYAQNVSVREAWVRSAVQSQNATGAFMKLTAKSATQLVAVSTPVAEVAEVHQMKLEGGVMKMRAVPVLDLPSGLTVELKPGGYHLMLMDLKAPLAVGSQVALTLHFKDAQGRASQMRVQLPVAARSPGTRHGQSDSTHGGKH